MTTCSNELRVLFNAAWKERAEYNLKVGTTAGFYPVGMVSSAAFNKSIIVSFGNVYGDEKWKLFSGCDLFVYSDEDHISILGRMK